MTGAARAGKAFHGGCAKAGWVQAPAPWVSQVVDSGLPTTGVRCLLLAGDASGVCRFSPPVGLSPARLTRCLLRITYL